MLNSIFDQLVKECRGSIVMYFVGLLVILPVCFLLLRSRGIRIPPSEETRRAFLTKLLLIGELLGAWFFSMCMLMCVEGPPCSKSWDLNCHGSAPLIYRLLALAAVVCTLITAGVAYWVHLRSRRTPTDP